MESDKLILITPASNYDNLISVADSVRRYVHGLDYVWLICKDEIHGVGDFDEFIRYSKKHKLRVIVGTTADLNQSSSGGDLINGPLKELVETLDKPLHTYFTYVLFDDNLIHPFMMDAYLRFRRSYPERSILWLPYMQSTGVVTHVWDGSQFATDEYGNYFNMSDFSSTIIRLDLIVSAGFYGSGNDFNVTWLKPLIESNKDNVVFSNDIEPYDTKRLVAANSNAVRTNKDFDEIDSKLGLGSHSDIKIRYQVGLDTYPVTFTIPDELGKVILDMIRLEYKSKGYIK